MAEAIVKQSGMKMEYNETVCYTSQKLSTSHIHILCCIKQDWSLVVVTQAPLTYEAFC